MAEWNGRPAASASILPPFPHSLAPSCFFPKPTMTTIIHDVVVVPPSPPQSYLVHVQIYPFYLIDVGRKNGSISFLLPSSNDSLLFFLPSYRTYENVYIFIHTR